jgi:phospholipase/carboxylesterase
MNHFKLETDLSVKAEINLYYDLYIPENFKGRAPLLIAVHGYGAHKRYMMREAQAVAPENFVIASLQAPHQHFRQTESGYKIGFGWLTDYNPQESVALHHDFVLQIVERLAENETIDRAQVYLYGFSQACALNFRFAFTFPETVKGIVGVCGGIPSDLETNEIYKSLNAEVFYLYSTEDEFYPLEKYGDYIIRLEKHIQALQTRKYEAKHEITDEMRDDITVWLNEKTENPLQRIFR